MSRRRLRCGGACVLLLALSAGPSRSEQTRAAAATASDLSRGEADGVAITSRGQILLSPRITSLGKAGQGIPQSQVFAATSDGAGNVFLATGPDGNVVKVSATGDQQVYFHADEPLITAVAVLPAGELLAASAPGGKIYKVRPDGKGSVWCDTKERYVWAMAVNAAGSVFAATGDQGRLLRIDRNGNASVFFDSEDSHLVSLVLTDDGGSWVGGSSRGLVYRVDAEGHAVVAYDDELPEAKALLVTRQGGLVVAFDAPPASEKKPPALRLRMAGGTPGAKDVVTDLDAHQAPAMQGVIEGLPASEADETTPLRGKIVSLGPEGVGLELWRSRTETPFALAQDDEGRVLFATGEPGRLWRVEGPGDTALLATLREGQVTAFAGTRNGLVAATSNPAATYRLDAAPAGVGTFLAPPSDAGSVARWGTLRWQAGRASGRVEMFTRTGNSADPDVTWSAWSPAQVDPSGSPVANPEGRFLQWRARLSGASGGSPQVGGVVASYATRNRPPTIRDLRIEPASGALNGKATLRWSASDPDGDGVSVDVQARPVGSTDWKSAVRTDPPPPKSSDPSLGNDGSSKDQKATWDTSSWDEGTYEVRALASDQSSNPPTEGLETETPLPIVVVIDRTAPSIDAKRKRDVIEVEVTDALSGVMRLEVVADGRVAFSPRCADGVCDGRRESFRFLASQVGTGGATSLRAIDAAGNPVEAPVPAP